MMGFFKRSSNSSDDQDPYKILQTPKSASQQDLMENFLTLVKNECGSLRDLDNCSIKFTKLFNAFHVLSDENRRKVYDKNDSGFHPDMLNFEEAKSEYLQLMQSKFNNNQNSQYTSSGFEMSDMNDPYTDTDYFGAPKYIRRPFIRTIHPYRTIRDQFNKFWNPFDFATQLDDYELPENIKNKIENGQNVDETFVDANGTKVHIKVKSSQGNNHGTKSIQISKSYSQDKSTGKSGND